jgi:putative ABC transport system ATP-binding protein
MTEGPELGSSDMSSPVTASPQSNVDTATVTSVIGAESVGAVSGERGSGATVRLEGVTKRYAIDKDVVIMAADDVNLDFAAGSSTALMGASGSGKSTLLHLMGAMDTPTSGRIFIDGQEITALSGRKLAAHRRSIGFVFQRFHLLPALSVEANVMAPLLPYRTNFDLKARARELIASVGLAGRENTIPSRLSGGQQQRVAIARALIGRPNLLLADEPTGNLDSTTGDEILKLLFDLHRDHGVTLIIATHDPRVAERCQSIVRVKDGVVVAGPHPHGGQVTAPVRP